MALTRHLAPVDRWTLAYAAMASAALAWRWSVPLPGRGLFLVAHGLLLAVPFLAGRARRVGGCGCFFGEFYPLFLVTALYGEIGLLNSAIGISHDDRVRSWEAALFAGQPSRDWIRAQPWPWLSWLLHLGYLSYYLIVAGAPLGLWLSGRREEARRTILLMAAAFYCCFTLFLLFPVAGPRYEFPLARNAATETAVAVFTQRLLDRGAAWGTAFPSSHVAVALVASLLAWRFWRPLGAVLVPLAVLLTVGTVYGQFHYAVDALAGIVMAAAMLGLQAR